MMIKQFLLLTLLLFSSAVLLVVPQCVLSFDFSVNSWATRESAPFSGRFELAVVDNIVYAIGTSKIAEYDFQLDVWTLKNDLPINRTDFVLAVYDGLIYVIGGNGGLNQVYDPIAETWENKTSMPTPRTQLEANVVDGKFYLIGGRTGGQKTTKDLNEVYDPETDTWSTKKAIPFPVVGYASAVVDDKIYVVGGQNEFHELDTPLNIVSTQIYDTNTDAWSMGADIPECVWNAGAGATTGKNAPKRIYVVGGIHTGIQGSAFNQVYDPKTDTWAPQTRNIAKMSNARAWLNVAVVNDLLYAMGGSPGLFLSYTGINEQYIPYQFGTISPKVQLLSPENQTYPSNNVSLVFTVSKPVEWMGYIIDNQETITINGNMTLPSSLSSGPHNLTVYVKDEFTNWGISEVASFTVTKKPEMPSAFYFILISVVVAFFAGAVLLRYFKRR